MVSRSDDCVAFCLHWGRAPRQLDRCSPRQRHRLGGGKRCSAVSAGLALVLGLGVIRQSRTGLAQSNPRRPRPGPMRHAKDRFDLRQTEFGKTIGDPVDALRDVHRDGRVCAEPLGSSSAGSRSSATRPSHCRAPTAPTLAETAARTTSSPGTGAPSSRRHPVSRTRS